MRGRVALAQLVRAGARNPLAFLRLLRHLPTMARLYWRTFRDPRTGWRPRLALIVTVLYVLSPIDLVPEILFGPFGLVDDLGVLLFGLQSFLRLAPPAVVEEHLRALQGGPAPAPQ